MDKNLDAFRTIGELAEDLGVQQHVLRFWETKFPLISPMKRAGGRRYYRPDDVALVSSIRILLHDQGYTIKGVQRILKEQGVRAVLSAATTARSEGSRTQTTAASSAASLSIVPDLRAALGEASEPVPAPSFSSAEVKAPPSQRFNGGATRLSLKDFQRLQAVAAELGDCLRLAQAGRLK